MKSPGASLLSLELIQGNPDKKDHAMHSISPPLRNLISDALETFGARIERRLIPRGKEKLPYLYRNFLEGKQAPDGEPGLFLHKFVSSDQEGQLHNHPWQWSASFILVGAYKETRANIGAKEGDQILLTGQWKKRQFNAGDINFIRKDDFHRVDIVPSVADHVWTLFLHGPRVDNWSFVPEEYDALVTPRIVTKRTFDIRDKVTQANK